ncbi:hypothetical protein D9613_010117 [Agrocybe pediades]|uniref:DUF6534 domain-containing protein n=1 Tax=Agrocybe pediades TaxID=84607 RepID=A0A8H4QWP7_9AGAR|nr:hypothetical protein D9613_010117 [Agrocybe pediades]
MNISKDVDGIFVGMPTCSTLTRQMWLTGRLGFVAATTLLGITILQAWNYAQNNRDSWKLRSLVALLVALDIAGTIASSIFVHSYLIEHFGNFVLLSTVNDAFIVEFSFMVVVIFLVQLFFASRVHLLNPGNYWLASGIALGSLLSFVSTVYTIAAQLRHHSVQALTIPSINISAIIHQTLIILVDGCITFVLSWNFIKARSQSEVKRTQGLLQTLLTFVVARGVLLTLVDTASLFLWVVDSRKLYWIPIHLSLSKLYVISMIALLNTRTRGPSHDIHRRIFTDNNSFQLASVPSPGPRSIRPPVFAHHPSSGKNYNADASTFEHDNPLDPEVVMITHGTHVYHDSSAHGP